MQHRSIPDDDLDATARLVRMQAGTTDLREIAAALGIRVVERSWRYILDGAAIPGIILLCSTDTEEEKQATLAHEIAHILLARRPSTHGDVWYLGISLMRGLPLFDRVNDDLSWSSLFTSIGHIIDVPEGSNKQS